MSNRLGGSQRGTAYPGTNAVQPPDCTFAPVAPTIYDINYSTLDLWLNTRTNIAYILVSLAGNSSSAGPLATWVPLNGAGGGAITEIIPDSGTPVMPNGMGEITIAGGYNINTVGSFNTLTINLNDSIVLPATSADESSGVITIGTIIAFQEYGTDNVFVGSSGNFTLTGINNNGFGIDTLHNLTTGSNNSSYGNGSLLDITTGSNNIALGYQAGSDLAATESNNILIGNPGVPGDNNTMRLGNSGSGSLQQDKTYIGGIYASVGTLNSENGVVIVDQNDLAKMTRGVDGQVLIGSTGTGPIWNTLSSALGTIAITNGSGTINLETVGGTPAVTCAFLLQNTPNLTDVTGDGTVYQYGISEALLKIFDVGDNCTTGNGTTLPAIFTAPATSQYYLEITVNLTNLTADAGNDALAGTAQIVTSSTTYAWDFSPSSFAGAGDGVDDMTISFQQIVHMTAGDTATFNISTDMNGGGGNKVIGLGAGSYISGYLVSGAAFGTTSFVTDDGTAVPEAGVINVLGGQNIITSATTADTIQISVTGTTNHSLLVGNINGGISNLGVPTDGQIAIGSTAASPVLSTITAGANITVTNGPGSIIIASTGGGGGGTTWNPVAGTTQLMAVNNGYYTQNSALTTLTLPSVAAAGTILEICEVGVGGWTIEQSAGQNVVFLGISTTTGTGGSLSSNPSFFNCSIKLLCVVANTTWIAITSVGNFDLV